MDENIKILDFTKMYVKHCPTSAVDRLLETSTCCPISCASQFHLGCSLSVVEENSL